LSENGKELGTAKRSLVTKIIIGEFLYLRQRRTMQRLERCDVIYADGTFKTCPPPYTQFVTIHGLFQERVLPFVMCLMTGKTVGQYRQLLQHVKDKPRSETLLQRL
jgi:ubiquinone/menaquinone biosynthesis C-methylase UbiE